MKNMPYSLFLLALLMGAEARAQATQTPQSCLDQGFTTADMQKKGRLMTRDLSLALMTGDLPTMAAQYSAINKFIKDCADTSAVSDKVLKRKLDDLYVQICDADCHLTMAQYKLLLAADMPFLSSKTESKIDAITAQTNAEEGRKVIDRGLSVLVRQYAPEGDGAGAAKAANPSNVKDENSPDSSESKPSLFNFTFKQSRLLEAKARLLMAAGDNWYMAASNQQLIQVAYELSSALNKTGDGTNSSSASTNENMSFAQNFYREALWIIIEAKTDIPDQPIYSSLSNDLLAIQKDLETRVASAERGYLYLNIDPQDLNLASYDTIITGLQGLVSDIHQIEEKIESIIREGSGAKLSADLKDAATDVSKQLKRESDARYQSSQAINLSLQKIGQLQEDYQKVAEHTKRKLESISADKESSSYRRELSRIAFDLGQQKKEVDYKIQYLKAKKEQDMLAYSIENKSDKLNEIRWLMNHKISISSLEIQVLTFEAQIAEYQRNVDRNSDDIAGLNEAIDQKNLTITSINERKGQIVKEQETLTNQKTAVHMLKRAELRAQICSMETQLKMIKGDAKMKKVFEAVAGEEDCPALPESAKKDFTKYQEEVCAIRKDMGTESLKAQAYVLKCLLGKPLPPEYQVDVQCPALSGDSDLADLNSKRLLTQQMLDKNKASALQQIQNLEAIRNEYKSKMDGWMSIVSTVTNYVHLANSAAEIAATAYAAIAGTTPMVGAIAGPMGGALTIVDPKESAAANVEALKVIALGISTAADREIAFQHKKFEISKALADMASLLDKMRAAYEVDRLQYQLTFMELSLSESSELAKATSTSLQHKQLLLECDGKEKLELDAKIDNFAAQHDALLARLNMLAEDNKAIDNQFDNLTSQNTQQDLAIKITESEIKVLEKRRQLLVNDNLEIKKLQDNVTARITNTSSLKNELEADRRLGDSLFEEIQGMKKDRLMQTLALSDKEADFVKDQLNDKTEFARQERRGLEEKMAQVGLEENLRNGLLASYDAIQTEIAAQRKNVLDISQATAEDGGITPIDNSRDLYEVSRDQMFDLVRGLPDFVIAKKRKLDLANRLAFMAYKKRAVFQKLGGVPSPEEFNYMRSYDSLSKFAGEQTGSENGTLFRLDDTQVVLGYVGIEIPESSAFAQSMARNGEVTFQVNPSAAGNMAANGYLSIWPEDVDGLNKFSDPEIRLVDMLVVAGYKCGDGKNPETTNNEISITHTGHGYVFKKATPNSAVLLPALENVPFASWTDSVYRFTEGASGDLPNRLNGWTTKSAGFTVGSFDKDLPDRRAKLPFLGYPLLATYKLKAEASDCSRSSKNPVTGEIEGVAYKLYFVYARPKQ